MLLVAALRGMKFMGCWYHHGTTMHCDHRGAQSRIVHWARLFSNLPLEKSKVVPLLSLYKGGSGHNCVHQFVYHFCSVYVEFTMLETTPKTSEGADKLHMKSPILHQFPWNMNGLAFKV